MAETNLQNPFKVKLIRASADTVRGVQNIRDANDPSEVVVFDVTPDIVETRNVNYDTHNPLHMPGQNFVYNYTSARVFNISGVKLISRTPREATLNLFRIGTLRSWTMPRFGASQDTVRAARGAPPAVLHFSAYADVQHTQNIYRVPVIIQSLSVSYPSEPDYMPSERLPDEHLRHIPAGTPFPAVTTLDLQLMETHSPREYAKFKLEDFKKGNLSFF